MILITFFLGKNTFSEFLASQDYFSLEFKNRSLVRARKGPLVLPYNSQLLPEEEISEIASNIIEINRN